MGDLYFSLINNYKFSASFMKEKQRYKWLKTAKSISILSLVPGLLLTARSAGRYSKIIVKIYNLWAYFTLWLLTGDLLWFY